MPVFQTKIEADNQSIQAQSLTQSPLPQPIAGSFLSGKRTNRAIITKQVVIDLIQNSHLNSNPMYADETLYYRMLMSSMSKNR
jgi:hypothetical protein